MNNIIPKTEWIKTWSDNAVGWIQLSHENKLPIIVFDMNQENNLLKVLNGENVGTLVNL